MTDRNKPSQALSPKDAEALARSVGRRQGLANAVEALYEEAEDHDIATASVMRWCAEFVRRLSLRST